MNGSNFDTWTRRRIGLAAGGLAASWLGLATHGSTPTAARKKRKKKQVKRNGFGCVDVGNFCQNGRQCCSGICTGKKGKKTCNGHDQSTCQAGQDVCGGLEASCTTTAGQNGECVRTTGKASYCAGDGDCFPCAKDADCVPFCGPQAACIVCADCLEINGGETLCAGLIDNECTFPE